MFQIFLSNTNNSVHQVFLCNMNNLHTAVWFLITIILSKRFNSSIWLIEGTLIDTTTLVRVDLGGKGNQRALHIPQSSKTEALPSNVISRILVECVCGRGSVGLFGRDLVGYQPSINCQQIFIDFPISSSSRLTNHRWLKYIWTTAT